MTREISRDRVRAYDVYAVAASILVGLGSVASTLALAFGETSATLLVAALPLALGVGLLVRLASGWRPADRSLDRTVPQEGSD